MTKLEKWFRGWKTLKIKTELFAWLRNKSCPRFCDDIIKISYVFLALLTFGYWGLVNYNYYCNAGLTQLLNPWSEVYCLLIGSYAVLKNVLRMLKCGHCKEKEPECPKCRISNGFRGFRFVIMWMLSSVGVGFYRPYGINEAASLMFAVASLVVLTFALNKIAKHFIREHRFKLNNYLNNHN